MGGIARVGDIVGRGGILVGPFSPDVTVNGRPVALEGCVWTPHPPCNPYDLTHCFGVVLSVPSGVTVNGVPPITKGAISTCKDPVLTASNDVMVADGLLGTLVSLGASFVGGDVGQISGYERIGYTAAGSLLSGEDPNKVLTGAAIQVAGVAGTNELTGELVSQGVNKAVAVATAQATVAAGTAAVTKQDVGVAVAGSVASSAANAAAGEVKKVLK